MREKQVQAALNLLDETVQAAGGSERTSQREMSQQIAAMLGQEKALLAQAGTGTGKSLAYLAPAFEYAYDTDGRVVISTATLALQRQLVQKDIPAIQAQLAKQGGKPVKTALFKGFSNYVCLNKLQGSEESNALFSLFEALEQDSSVQGTGKGTGQDVKGKPSKTGKTGKGQGAPQKAPKGKTSSSGYDFDTSQELSYLRKWAKTTQDGDRDTLPGNIGASAWSKVSISGDECPADSCAFYNECFPRKARRLASEAKVVVTNHAMLGVYCAGASELLGEFEALIVDEGHELPDIVRDQCSFEFTVSKAEIIIKAIGRKLAIPVDVALQSLSDLRIVCLSLPEGSFDVMPEELASAFANCDLHFTDISGFMENKRPEGEDEKSVYRILRPHLDSLLDAVRTMLKFDPLVHAFWCEKTPMGESALHIGQMDVSERIAKLLLAQRSAVITSATLRTGNDMSYFAQRCGLGEANPSLKWESVEYASPFNYSKQGILYVAEDLPSPGRDGLHPDLLERITDLVLASDGGMLGLFSSRAGASAAADYLREQTDLPILLQGEASLPALIEQYREDPQACLLGTLSLWQGVDVPGLTSRLVVIDRIPFPRPTEPFTQARTRALQAQGKNPFMQVSLTHASLLLAQGVGRLIRSVDDLGVVAVLDSRLVRSGYGGYLRQSLPDFWFTTQLRHPLEALQRLKQKF